MEEVWATSMLPHFSCSGSSSSKLPAALLTAPRPPTWASDCRLWEATVMENASFHQVSSTDLLWQLDVSGFPGRFSRKFHTARHTSRLMTFLWSSQLLLSGPHFPQHLPQLCDESLPPNTPSSSSPDWVWAESFASHHVGNSQSIKDFTGLRVASNPHSYRKVSKDKLNIH